jgi:ABC-2 type transport system permease protein
MGLLGSALVSSVIMAFMISLILNLSLMFLGVGGELANSETAARFFGYINWEPILKEFSTGVIRTTSILYLVSIVVVALFCAERMTESSRWK